MAIEEITVSSRRSAVALGRYSDESIATLEEKAKAYTLAAAGLGFAALIVAGGTAKSIFGIGAAILGYSAVARRRLALELRAAY